MTWSNTKPTVPGVYRLRDPVFGWGPTEVTVAPLGITGLHVTTDSVHWVPVFGCAAWLEWKPVMIIPGG